MQKPRVKHIRQENLRRRISFKMVWGGCSGHLPGLPATSATTYSCSSVTLQKSVLPGGRAGLTSNFSSTCSTLCPEWGATFAPQRTEGRSHPLPKWWAHKAASAKKGCLCPTHEGPIGASYVTLQPFPLLLKLTHNFLPRNQS